MVHPDGLNGLAGKRLAVLPHDRHLSLTLVCGPIYGSRVLRSQRTAATYFSIPQLVKSEIWMLETHSGGAKPERGSIMRNVAR
jgi:hypothetical protein